MKKIGNEYEFDFLDDDLDTIANPLPIKKHLPILERVVEDDIADLLRENNWEVRPYYLTGHPKVDIFAFDKQLWLLIICKIDSTVLTRKDLTKARAALKYCKANHILIIFNGEIDQLLLDHGRNKNILIINQEDIHAIRDKLVGYTPDFYEPRISPL